MFRPECVENMWGLKVRRKTGVGVVDRKRVVGRTTGICGEPESDVMEVFADLTLGVQ